MQLANEQLPKEVSHAGSHVTWSRVTSKVLPVMSSMSGNGNNNFVFIESVLFLRSLISPFIFSQNPRGSKLIQFKTFLIMKMFGTF